MSVAARMISKPSASLPEQMRRRKHLVAAYRLLSEPDVPHAALIDIHCRLTLSAALRQPLVLLVQDTTELDYSRYAHYHSDPFVSGLGPIGEGHGRGMLVQTLLQRQLHSGQALKRLLGLCAPIAMRLLQLREIARLEPERLASEELPGELVQPVELVQVVGALAEMEPEEIERLTVGRFWKEVAKPGGHQGRRRDGPPGWKTLWRGWIYVQTIMQGVHLNSHLHSPP